MSGSRRKALKRAFRAKHGRSPGRAVWKYGLVLVRANDAPWPVDLGGEGGTA